jgi:ribosomal protein S18 acetylase RimI-like enzyme
MYLTTCDNPSDLIAFLKSDYANNLYFFTYLSEMHHNPATKILIAKLRGEIVAAILLTSVHCCISASNTKIIPSLADQLPSVDSIHVVGRSDLVEYLLQVCKGPERDKHSYALCEYSWVAAPEYLKTESRKASKTDLNDLIDFYNRNDMLIDAENRLPAILSWGRVYLVEKDDKMVSCALTTTETDDAAMIGSVYTIPDFRNQGHARDCVFNLCQDLISNRKRPYLFYREDNNSLRKLYYCLGFRQINTWILATRIN